MQKNELRNIIREKKRRFVKEELDEAALLVAEKLKRHPRFVAARTILLYHSLPDEVSTAGLIASAGKIILLPRVTGDGTMELCLYTGPDDMRPGAYGIMEPCGSVFTRYSDIELAVVPGMAFDVRGHRLGRGKGYYDRFLPKLDSAYKIGICFGFQVVDEVPVDENDIPMDEVIFSDR